MMDGRTQIYGVIGNPVRHSLSPAMHNRAFQRLGINAAYLAFEVEDLAQAVGGIRGLGIQGISVTIPFKSAVIPLLDEVEERARKIGAVNTIARKNGKLIGYNTDAGGAMEAVQTRVELKGKRVLLLGAGGAARAIAFGLRERASEVYIGNRTLENALALAAEMGAAALTAAAMKQMRFDAVINASAVGMEPDAAANPLPKGILKEGMTVMDIVYRPLRTQLLREAEKAGCLTIDGLEMLARQGAGQLEIWTGKKSRIAQMKEDLREAIENERKSRRFP
jgi:shikimate dehydrogenase